jgi:hypothetical protein
MSKKPAITSEYSILPRFYFDPMRKATIEADAEHNCAAVVITVRSQKTHFKPQIYRFLIDEADVPLVKPFDWKLSKTGHAKRPFYTACFYVGQSEVFMHRLLTQCPSHLVVDHINRNVFDNRRSINLRVCTIADNVRNSPKNRSRGLTSKYKGVTRHSDFGRQKVWQAVISPSGRKFSLGYYATEEEAALAYNAAAIKYYGEFAGLNDVRESAVALEEAQMIHREPHKKDAAHA